MEVWAVLVCSEAWLHRYRMFILLQDLGHPWTSFTRSICIHTDPFIMISGLLTSYSFYKQLERTKRLDIPREYVSRLMRYSTQFCVKYVSRLMRYSTQLCVKYVSSLMSSVHNSVLSMCPDWWGTVHRSVLSMCPDWWGTVHSSVLCMCPDCWVIVHTSVLCMCPDWWGTVHSYMLSHVAMLFKLCFVVRNITVVPCNYVFLLLHVAIYHTHHQPNTPVSLTRNNSAVKTSYTATVTRYSGRY